MLNRSKKLPPFARIVTSVIIITLICVCGVIVATAPAATDSNEIAVPIITETGIYEQTEQVIILNDTPILFTELEYKVFYDYQLSIEYLKELEVCMQVLSNNIKSNEYTDKAVCAMQAEIDHIQTIYNAVESDASKYASWEDEYYYATKTYLFFKQHGFSDAVVCAMLGNMMVETSGGTLALKPNIYSPSGSFYGLCQWSLYYRPNVADMTFENQLTYLLNDLEYEFNTFGFCYKRGFSYEDFLAMEDPSEAAYVFAKVYERCDSGTYDLRKQAAIKAYKYFVYGDYDE